MSGRRPTQRGAAPHYTSPASARSALRAPAHNPYDKFTQAEFDAWIGDITGALRRALGQEETFPKPTRSYTKAEDSVYDEEVGEDSFAQLKARRAAKGKQRATYEDVDNDELDDKEVESSILAGDDQAEADDVERDSGGQWADANGEWSHSEEEVSLGDSDSEVSEDVGNPDAPIEISDDEDNNTQFPVFDEREDDEPDEDDEDEQHAHISETYEEDRDEHDEEEEEEDQEGHGYEVVEIEDDEEDEGTVVNSLDRLLLILNRISTESAF